MLVGLYIMRSFAVGEEERREDGGCNIFLDSLRRFMKEKNV